MKEMTVKPKPFNWGSDPGPRAGIYRVQRNAPVKNLVVLPVRPVILVMATAVARIFARRTCLSRRRDAAQR